MKLIPKKRSMMIAAVSAAVVVTPFVSVPAASAATLSCSSSTSLNLRPKLHYRDRGTCVKELQRRLVAHGYSVGSYGIDGDFGPATLRALKRFQSAKHLTVDGVVGPVTWSALLAGTKKKTPPPPKTASCSSHPTTRYGARGSCVKDIQQLLIRHGYSVGSAGADGVFGPATLRAVKRYQSAKGLVVDGIVGPKTWSSLLGKTVTSKPSTSYNKYRCGNVSNKLLLVFDDYPMSSAAFKKLIDTAKANNIGIGVAPNGMYVPGRAPVDYARKKGMLVVDHTWDHKDLTTLSYSQIVWEITRPNIGSNFVRPPYGAENSTVRRAFANYGKYDCWWSIDPQDWAAGVSPKTAANRLISMTPKSGGTAVVHMNHLGTQPELLPYIKRELAKQGKAMCKPWPNPTPKVIKNGVYCR